MIATAEFRNMDKAGTNCLWQDIPLLAAETRAILDVHYSAYAVALPRHYVIAHNKSLTIYSRTSRLYIQDIEGTSSGTKWYPIKYFSEYSGFLLPVIIPSMPHIKPSSSS
jgi:hypothetical protein